MRIGDLNFSSNSQGRFCGNILESDSLHISAFGYKGRILLSPFSNQVYLEPDVYVLDEVLLSTNGTKTHFLKDAKPRKVFQRGAGESIFRRAYSEKPVIIDSLKIFVKESHRSSNYLRVVLCDKRKKILAKSKPLSVPLKIENSYYNLPTGYWRCVSDTFYIGLEFLEESVAPDSFNVRKYQIRKEGILSPQNNGISLGGFKLEGPRQAQTYTTFFAKGELYHYHGTLNWSCYLGVYYSGDGKIEAL